MAGTCRKGFSKNLETYPCIIARPGADFNGQMRFCGLKLREHPYPFGSLTPSPPIFWPNIRSLCAPPVRSEANAGACRVAAYGNQIVSPRCCRTSPHIPHAETVQLLLGFNAPQYSPAFSFIPTLYMIPPHMPSAGPRRSASDHAHIATWFCISPVYPALPCFAVYASRGSGAAFPGL